MNLNFIFPGTKDPITLTQDQVVNFCIANKIAMNDDFGNPRPVEHIATEMLLGKPEFISIPSTTGKPTYMNFTTAIGFTVTKPEAKGAAVKGFDLKNEETDK